MRLAALCLVASFGCATAPDKDALDRAYRALPCREKCFYNARICREQAIEDSSGGFGLYAVLDRSQQSGRLENCAATKEECIQVCASRER